MTGGSMYTTTEVARMLGVSLGTLTAWRQAGDGPPFIQVGATVRYPPDAYKDWVNSQLETHAAR